MKCLQHRSADNRTYHTRILDKIPIDSSGSLAWVRDWKIWSNLLDHVSCTNTLSCLIYALRFEDVLQVTSTPGEIMISPGLRNCIFHTYITRKSKQNNQPTFGSLEPPPTPPNLQETEKPWLTHLNDMPWEQLSRPSWSSRYLHDTYTFRKSLRYCFPIPIPLYKTQSVKQPP